MHDKSGNVGKKPPGGRKSEPLVSTGKYKKENSVVGKTSRERPKLGTDGLQAAKGTQPARKKLKLSHSNGDKELSLENTCLKGTLKYAIFEVLKRAKGKGLTADDIILESRRAGIKDIQDEQKRQVTKHLSSGDAFCRLEKAVYSLRAFYPEGPKGGVHLPDNKTGQDKKAVKAGQDKKAVKAGQDKKAVKAGQDKKAVKAGQDKKAVKTGYGRRSSNTGEEKKSNRDVGAMRKRDVVRLEKKIERLEQQMNEKKQKMNQYEKEIEDMKNKSPELLLPLEQVILEAVAPEDLVRFELTEEDKIYAGPDDRKLILEHRQKVQAKAKQMEKDKEEYVKVRTDAVMEERKKLLSDIRLAEIKLHGVHEDISMLNKDIENTKASIAAFEQRREQMPQQKTQKAKVSDRNSSKSKVEKKNKETHTRYPIEDTDLEVSTALYEPEWLDDESCQMLIDMITMTENLSLIGSRALGMKPPNVDEIQKALELPTKENDLTDISLDALDPLCSLYKNTLRLVIDDRVERGVAWGTEKRWRQILTEGTWPEILRRFVISKDKADDICEFQKPNSHESLAASMLAYDPFEALTFDQHAALLNFLAGKMLMDSVWVRQVLQNREDKAITAKRDAREGIAEERKRLKELQQANKYISEKLESTMPSIPGGAILDGEPDLSDLPEELRVYKGDPSDPKSIEEFKRKQRLAVKNLEKANLKSYADQVRAKRAEESRINKMKEEEILLQKKKEATKEALLLAQQAYEEKIGKFKLRQEPVGKDRYLRKYWWGLGGCRYRLMVEDSNGRCGLISTSEDFLKLMDSLDERGIRERALKESLAKKADSILLAMKRHETKGAEVKKDKPLSAPKRQSARESKQVEFFDPSKPNTVQGKHQGDSTNISLYKIRDKISSLPVPPSDIISIAETLHVLHDIKKKAQVSGISMASEKDFWGLWTREIDLIGAEGGTAHFSDVIKTLKDSMMDLEAMLYNKCDDLHGKDADMMIEEEAGPDGLSADTTVDEDTSDEDSYPGELVMDTVDSSFSPRKSPNESKFLWQTVRERIAWLSDVKSALTSAKVCFCVHVLFLQAKPVFRYLDKAGSGKK